MMALLGEVKGGKKTHKNKQTHSLLEKAALIDKQNYKIQKLKLNFEKVILNLYLKKETNTLSI